MVGRLVEQDGEVEGILRVLEDGLVELAGCIVGVNELVEEVKKVSDDEWVVEYGRYVGSRDSFLRKLKRQLIELGRVRGYVEEAERYLRDYLSEVR